MICTDAGRNPRICANVTRMVKGNGRLQRICAQCGNSFMQEIQGSGRPKSICSDECRKARAAAKVRDYYRVNPKRGATCVDCGGPCQRSKPKSDWEPPPQPRCMKCFVAHRRRNVSPAEPCHCGRAKDPNSQQCRECYRETMRTHRIAVTKKFDYDKAHRRLRKAWEVIVELTEVPCARCQQPIIADQAWHLDHTDDRTGYLGPSHSRCNLQAAGITRKKRLYGRKNHAIYGIAQ